MAALREGGKFIDLFLSQKSSKFISVLFYEKENQVQNIFLSIFDVILFTTFKEVTGLLTPSAILPLYHFSYIFLRSSPLFSTLLLSTSSSSSPSLPPSLFTDDQDVEQATKEHQTASSSLRTRETATVSTVRSSVLYSTVPSTFF